MPHIHIKHFPIEMTKEEIDKLSLAMTQLIQTSFDCTNNVISIALESVEPNRWMKEVYDTDITNDQARLIKAPKYS